MSGQRSDWREGLHANPSRMEQELAFKLQDDGIHYQTQVEIPVSTADFYFPLESRPLLVFVDGRVHLGKAQIAKDEELRTLPEERIQGSGIVLRQLLGQEKRPAIPTNSE
jgi:very-short-patch-repair endonuclease